MMITNAAAHLHVVDVMSQQGCSPDMGQRSTSIMTKHKIKGSEYKSQRATYELVMTSGYHKSKT